MDVIMETENRITHKDTLKFWIEATRPRTLPVSIAGVLAGCSCAMLEGGFRFLPAFICFMFALLAQISSNFANEYFDFRYGLDKKGREGFRRGVTEGDISPTAMRNALISVLLLTAITGCMLLFFGNPAILLPAGALIGIFALAYSAGPWPLSHHGLGDIAVIVFFGLVPVVLTAYVQTGDIHSSLAWWQLALAVGLMSANVLIVNNYRDVEDDRAVGKHTTAVIFGARTMSTTYLLSGIAACTFAIYRLFGEIGAMMLLPAGIYLCIHILIWRALIRRTGSLLNPLLGLTAVNMMIFTILLLIICACI